MAVLRRNDVSIHYTVTGSGPAVLLTHGYSATSAMWDGQIDALGVGRTLVTWDVRGHGQSDSPSAPEAYSEAETTADMTALLDAVGAEKAVIGGLSLGGYLSLAFYLDYPERTSALIVMDTGPGYKNPNGRAEWNRTAVARADAIDRDGQAALGGGSAERATAKHRSAKGLAMAARHLLTQHTPRVIESLPDIAVPTLVIVGAEDKPFLAATDYMARKIPGAEKVVIPNAGHAVNIDQPEAFNAAVDDFLTRNGL